MQSPSSKIALTTSLDTVTAWSKETFPIFLEVCKENVLDHRYVIYFQKNSYLVAPINRMLRRFKANGLISFWIRDAIASRYLVKPPAPKEPKKLNIDQLMGGVCLLAFGLLIGLFFFIIELTSLKIRQLKSIVNPIQSIM